MKKGICFVMTVALCAMLLTACANGSGQQELSEGNIMDLERAAQIGTVTAGTEYNEEMIIVAPQPNDWGETSKRQTIGLTEYILAAYNIDSDMVYISGYSGGGETLSLAVSERPDLYTAALHVSSKWDGDLDKVAESKMPVYFVIGESFDLYKDGYVYYGITHKHTGSSFAYTVSSSIDLFAFDARVGMEMIDQPLLMMAGKCADTLYMTEGCYERATGTKNKELFLIDGATHIKTYWFPEYVEKITNKLREFFGTNL